MTAVLVAGGGTAGHIEPALALADALCEIDGGIRVVALGTEKGLETSLVPARGYRLALIPPVPLPRKPSADLVSLPARLRRAIRATRTVLTEERIDAVVGFGGYVALPAYLAARGRVPIVVHEANARAGLANKVGARFAAAVAAAVPGSGLPGAQVLGNPVRRTISTLDRAATRAQARAHFGLDAAAPTVLVTGGSQGAQRINTAIRGAADDFAAAGIGVLHHHGAKNSVPPVHSSPAYVTVPYIERMDLAYAAADLVVARSGAMTVAEVGAVGLPAVYVPLPHGNGEQRLNAVAQVGSGAAVLVPDEEFTTARVRTEVIALLTDPQRLADRQRAATAGAADRADLALAHLVIGVLGEHGGAER